eukprot:gene32087-40564_t
MGSAGEKLGLPPGRVTRAQSQQQQGADAILDDGPGSMAVHLKDVKKHDLPEMMQHYITIKVVESLRWGGVRGSLLSVLDTCQTRMGSRCLRRWLLEPLRDPAAIHVRQDAVQTFSVLINPERPVSKKITEITGITNEMVNRPDVPPFSKVIEQMLCFCGDGEVCFVGHNAKSFDVPFLAAEFARVEKTLPSTWRFLDSLQIAKALEWDLHDSGRPDKLNQQALRRHFSLEALRRDPSCSIQAHRALDDAWVLSHILESMLAPLG